MLFIVLVSCKRGWLGVREDLQVLTLPFIPNNKDLSNFKLPVPKSSVEQPIWPGELREFPQTQHNISHTLKSHPINNTIIVSDHQNDFCFVHWGRYKETRITPNKSPHRPYWMSFHKRY